MAILKTLMFFADMHVGVLYKVDTIRFEEKLWLVPEWLDNPKAGWRTPVRIICLDGLPYETTPRGPTDFVLTTGMSKPVFEGHVQPHLQSGLVVRERPDIRFPAFGG